MTKLLPLVVAATLVATLTSARAEIIEYYVGVDTRAIWPSGIYASQPNPNHNRLTFLYAHGFAQTPFNNHYHLRVGLGGVHHVPQHWRTIR
jgi:hypothetical protein